MHKTLYRTSGSSISSFSTVVGITLVLTILGVVVILYFLAGALTSHYTEQLTVQVYLIPDVAEKDVLQLKKELEGEDFTGAVTYLSAAEAAAQFSKELGQDFVDVSGFNPLPATLDIKVDKDFRELAKLEAALNPLRNHALVDDLVYQKGMVQQMYENIGKLSIGFFLVGLLLLVIAVALINNTIMLAIFSQRFIIKSMQLVGATHWFIQKPFLWRGLKYGLVSSLFAITLLCAVLYTFRETLASVLEVLGSQYRYLWVMLAIAGTGLLVSWISTAFAVRRFVVLKQEKLY
ncbi:MAG: permease-like cell division protein FtsX [Flavobacteriales bacterium]|nr:permease-like cell division protein FtsX [Flavobacteriales bacterium]